MTATASRTPRHDQPVRWREAMASGLYGEGGFYVRDGSGPAGHFRTSAHASPQFAEAVLRLLEQVDEELGHPDPLDLVDVGAGRGELLSAMLSAAPPGMAARLRPTAVEQRPTFVQLLSPERQQLHKPSRSSSIPETVTGLLIATEWLDNVPVDVAELDDTGLARYVMVDSAGEEALGDPVTGEEAQWLERWWPLSVPGTRAEIGSTRDAAWAGAVAALDHGLALAVDYGHLASERPPFGTLAGYRDGREVPPVPDGSCDVTAHVAMDSLGSGRLLRQAEALRAFGVSGTRPPLALASTDPAAYLRRLAAASAAAELTEPAGLGGHYWLLRPVGIALTGL